MRVGVEHLARVGELLLGRRGSRRERQRVLHAARRVPRRQLFELLLGHDYAAACLERFTGLVDQRDPLPARLGNRSLQLPVWGGGDLHDVPAGLCELLPDRRAFQPEEPVLRFPQLVAHDEPAQHVGALPRAVVEPPAHSAQWSVQLAFAVHGQDVAQARQVPPGGVECVCQRNAVAPPPVGERAQHNGELVRRLDVLELAHRLVLERFEVTRGVFCVAVELRQGRDEPLVDLGLQHDLRRHRLHEFHELLLGLADAPGLVAVQKSFLVIRHEVVGGGEHCEHELPHALHAPAARQQYVDVRQAGDAVLVGGVVLAEVAGRDAAQQLIGRAELECPGEVRLMVVARQLFQLLDHALVAVGQVGGAYRVPPRSVLHQTRSMGGAD